MNAVPSWVLEGLYMCLECARVKAARAKYGMCVGRIFYFCTGKNDSSRTPRTRRNRKSTLCSKLYCRMHYPKLFWSYASLLRKKQPFRTQAHTVPPNESVRRSSRKPRVKTKTILQGENHTSPSFVPLTFYNYCKYGDGRQQ